MSEQILEHNKRYLNSFTLVELAIVMVLMGIILANFLVIVTNKSETDKIRETNETLDKIEQAVYNYLAENGSIPCPADAGLVETNTSFGIATRDSSTAYFCDGTASYSYWSGAFPSMDIGNVPNRTLNIPDELTYDAWGRRIAYVMMENCNTSNIANLPGYYPNIANPGYNSTSNFSNSSVCGVGGHAAAQGIEIVDASGTTITNNAVLVLISYGKNGHGAYPHTGGTTRYCAGGTISNDEITNALMDSSCNLTTASLSTRGVWVQKAPIYSPPVYAPGASTASSSSYFDDILRYKTRDQLIRGARMIASSDSTALSYLCSMVNNVVSSLAATSVICGTNLSPNTGDANCSPNILWVLASQLQKMCL